MPGSRGASALVPLVWRPPPPSNPGDSGDRRYSALTRGYPQIAKKSILTSSRSSGQRQAWPRTDYGAGVGIVTAGFEGGRPSDWKPA